MKIEAHADVQKDFTDEQVQKLYLIHHMHHFKNNHKICHELHHCFLFEDTGMNGKKHAVSHTSTKNELHHIIDGDFTGTLFDHKNNEFSIINGIISL